MVWRGLQQDGGPRHTGKEVEESVEEVAGVYVVDGRAPRCIYSSRFDAIAISTDMALQKDTA